MLVSARLSLIVCSSLIGISFPVVAHGQSACTPQHLVETLRQVEGECGPAKTWGGYRRGAVIRGTRHRSQHAYCNGVNGAIDAVFSNRACALAALRRTGYMVITYGWSPHIHFGTDGAGIAAAKTWPRTVASADRGGRERRGSDTKAPDASAATVGVATAAAANAASSTSVATAGATNAVKSTSESAAASNDGKSTGTSTSTSTSTDAAGSDGKSTSVTTAAASNDGKSPSASTAAASNDGKSTSVTTAAAATNDDKSTSVTA
jgi:hypothetical protein